MKQTQPRVNWNIHSGLRDTYCLLTTFILAGNDTGAQNFRIVFFLVGKYAGLGRWPTWQSTCLTSMGTGEWISSTHIKLRVAEHCHLITEEAETGGSLGFAGQLVQTKWTASSRSSDRPVVPGDDDDDDDYDGGGGGVDDDDDDVESDWEDPWGWPLLSCTHTNVHIHIHTVIFKWESRHNKWDSTQEKTAIVERAFVIDFK